MSDSYDNGLFWFGVAIMAFVLLMAVCIQIGAYGAETAIFRSIENTGQYASGDRRIIGKIEYRVDGWQAERPTETGDRK